MHTKKKLHDTKKKKMTSAPCAVVGGAFYALSHLISSFHIGNSMTEEVRGFPRAMQLVSPELDSHARSLYQGAGA